MSSKLLTGGGLLLGVVLLLAVNILSGTAFKSTRLDLTDNKLFTLSQGTRNILAELDEPVTLRLFLSQKAATRLPGISTYATRVRELLEEYRRAADGSLVVDIIDPEPFSEQEDRAVGYGLQGVPLDNEGTMFYFGLVGASSTDEEETIPFLSQEREEFLEYDITKMVFQLAHPKQKVIGLISSLPMNGLDPRMAMARGTPQAPWVVLEQMRQLFEVRDLESDTDAIPKDVDVLMLAHPKELSDKTLYAIDQFVLGGGRALVFVDPYAEADQAGPAGMMPGGQARGSELDTLLASWGLELVSSKVVGDLQLATPVRFNRDGRAMTMDYPVWMNVPASLLDSEDIVTADLSSMTLATAGSLKTLDGAGVRVAPLIQSGPTAAELDTSLLGFLNDPQELLRAYKPGNEPRILAARVTGRAKSAFADGPPTDDANSEQASDESESKDAADDASAEPAHLAESKDDINVIVMADSDLLQDQFWVQVQNFLGNRLAIPTAANGTFVVNALENLTGSNDLISVRNRGRFSRPFTRVNAIREDAELEFREKEQQLLNRLEDTEQKLLDLERNKQEDDALILSDAQRREIARFRDEKVRIRTELRDVRHELRKNIESLETWLKFINIGLVPLLIAAGGLVVAVYQVRRRRSVRHATPA